MHSYLKGDNIVFLEIAVDTPVQLAEGRQTSSAHPHDEMLVLDACNDRLQRIINSQRVQI